MSHNIYQRQTKRVLANITPPHMVTNRIREKYYNIERQPVTLGDCEDRDKIAFNQRFQLTYPRSQRYRRVNYFPHEMKYRKSIAEAILYKNTDGISNSIDDIWRPSLKVPRIKLLHSIGGFNGGKHVKIINDDGSEMQFGYGNHSGVAFKPTKNHQMMLLANSWQDSTLAHMFIAGAQRDQILLNMNPSPRSYLLAGDAFMKVNGAQPNPGASCFILSKCSGLFYAHVGVDYDFTVLRNHEVISKPRSNTKRSLVLEQGDVIFIGCKKTFAVANLDDIADLTDRISGPTSVAQYCSAAVSETTVCVAEYIRDKLFDRADHPDYHINIVCALAVVTNFKR